MLPTSERHDASTIERPPWGPLSRSKPNRAYCAFQSRRLAAALPRSCRLKPNLTRERIYVAIQSRLVASGIEFDWDDENKKHLAAHKVAPAEFEQVLNNDPIDLAFDLIDDEERYRSVGLTNSGRLLSVAWAIRNGKVRAITAFPASVSDRKAFLEKPK